MNNKNKIKVDLVSVFESDFERIPTVIKCCKQTIDLSDIKNKDKIKLKERLNIAEEIVEKVVRDATTIIKNKKEWKNSVYRQGD